MSVRRWLLRALLAVGIAAIALSGPAGAAPAGTLVGNGTPLSCNESAFSAAVAAGGRVTFNCGGPLTIVLTSPQIIHQPVVIDGGDIITLSGNLTTRLFTVQSSGMLNLRDITLEKGNSGAANGGAIANDGWLSLHLVLIQKSVTDANHRGGAIATTGPVTIDDSTLSNNQAGSGGAIYATSSGGQIQLDATSIDLNKALTPNTGVGGGILLDTSAGLYATGNQFVQNSAPKAGGAVYLSPGTQATFVPHGLTGAFIFNNSAQNSGGAIFNQAGLLTLQGAVLESNHTLTTTLSTGFGGAVTDDGTLIVNDTQFRNNQGRFGGAVYVGDHLANASAGFTRTLFYANSAVDFGGALDAFDASNTVTIAASSFQLNHAGTGGGLARTNAHLSISNSSFTSNVAQNGGGLLLQGLPNPADASYVELRDSTISSNLATGSNSGGVENIALLDMRNVTLKDNNNGLNSFNGAIGRLQSSVLDNPGFPNCNGDGTLPTSGGSNYVTDASCALSGFQDTQGAGLNAMLGPLSTNPLVITWFHLPLPGSPLINHGDPGCSPTDQIYALRSGACDIGAVEFGGRLPRVYVPLLVK